MARRSRRLSPCSNDGFLMHCDVPQEVHIDLITKAGIVANLNGSARRDFNGRLDDVTCPISLARGDIAGKNEIRQSGQRDVMGAPNAGFKHASTPDRNARGLRNVVNALRFREAANAAELDVDDAAGAKADRLFGMMRRAYAFIETNRRSQPGLQLGMIDDFIVRQRLFNHHELKFIELFQTIRVLQSVSGVGIGHQLDVGKTFANLADHVHIPAGLDLHLDALVTSGEFGFDFADKIRCCILNADRYSAWDLTPRTAADALPERLITLAGFQIPDGRFQTAARHLMAANMREPRRNSLGVFKNGVQNTRRGVIANNQPRGVRPFLVIEGMLARSDFAPARDAVRDGFDENDFALRRAAETGLEEMDQRHAQEPQHDPLYFNCHFPSK